MNTPIATACCVVLESKAGFNVGEFQDKQERAWTDCARLRDKIRQSRWLSRINRLRIRFSLSGRRDSVFLKEMGRGHRNKLILDVGGGGRRHFFCDCGRGVEIDPVPERLRISKQLFNDVHQASATELPFPDESCDLVVSSDVIGHIPFEISDRMCARCIAS